MNQNRNKDNDLQRAIDEITQKGGASNGPKPAAPAPAPMGNPMMSDPAAMKMPAAPAPQMAMPSMPSMGGAGGGYGRPMGYSSDISKAKSEYRAGL